MVTLRTYVSDLKYFNGPYLKWNKLCEFNLHIIYLKEINFRVDLFSRMV